LENPGPLDWALAVAGDRQALGGISCEVGSVLVLALEDSKRRLQGRLRKLGAKANERITVCTDWPRIDQGGIEAIGTWLKQYPDARMVVIDTLAKIRPRGIPNKEAYQADVDALAELHRLANNRAWRWSWCSIPARLSPMTGWTAFSGTTGLTGTADSLLVLKRERGQADAFLFGTGRDLPELEMPLKFDEQTCRWHKLEMSAAEAHAITPPSLGQFDPRRGTRDG
jgi:AAA domain